MNEELKQAKENDK